MSFLVRSHFGVNLHPFNELFLYIVPHFQHGGGTLTPQGAIVRDVDKMVAVLRMSAKRGYQTALRCSYRKKVKYLREALSCKRCLCKNGCNWLALQCLCEEYKVNENHPPPPPLTAASQTATDRHECNATATTSADGYLCGRHTATVTAETVAAKHGQGIDTASTDAGRS